ncbi:MAG TPA: DUF3341 domain-containing protein, partial [bacterium]|nr:DUF3341 domain-containing protein [bacterium]
YPGQIRLYSPVPLHELDDVIDKKQSKIRWFSLAGALFGFTLGWVLTLYTSFEWNLITGGKPVASIPPYIIVAFEFTILFGALFTFIGLFVTSKLPRVSLFSEYDERFSVDKFGIFVECSDEESPDIKNLMESLGAEEVHSV